MCKIQEPLTLGYTFNLPGTRSASTLAPPSAKLGSCQNDRGSSESFGNEQITRSNQMFKMFSTMATLGLLVVSAAHAQSSEAVQAYIPFAFTAQHATLAAGNYRLTYSSSVHILSIRGLDQDSDVALVTAFPAEAGKPGRLVFHCYGEGCYLTRVWQGSNLGGRDLQLPQTDRERKLSFLTRVVTMTLATK
jgi:hypothetical protein